ncbi:single-stranded-DNA-specific exonuclease RecJ [Helicobacter sp. 13S00477-4]|uniref:single-stranded-DNA-specific exonuclease RecJ n=1 Tax=Helicobacter sp. 13S00477-4 TaxID=1905759 RepID=UPI000BA7947E|nr:single-stranded-DNA-specific exonuclease RecJ [Helicobacter sp. 13S00477-4]PAF51610.1 single-stranded-DNA-specific exonuclease RecJ [Helicobacter sp. 13S00477-4]
MTFLTKEKIKSILTQRFEGDIFASLKQLPHPFQLKGMEKAADLITSSIKNNQKILIVGDYDVDGITSCVIMMKFFYLLDYNNVSYVIPNRFNDGYGISKTIVQNNPADIIITVDNGISAFETAQYCKQNNIIFIITDHHTIKDKLPQADVIINPQQKDCLFPQKEICGATIAWYLCNAIKIKSQLQISLAPLLDMVCIATIADMMPLTKINKILVKTGLKKFIDSLSYPNQILKSHLKTKNPTAQDIAFYIAPLINSAGRMGDGNIAASFLLSSNQKEAQELYTKLNNLNKERKFIAQQTLELAQNTSMITHNCVIACGEGWHEGILGIVATNLSQNHCKPAIALSKKGKILKGSARSYGNINLIEVMNKHSDFFIHFGGHTKAVGLEMEEKNLIPLFEALKDFTMPEITETQMDEILGILDPKEIDETLLKILEEFEPYGEGNPQPNFICQNLKITSSKILKSLHQQLEFQTTFYKQKAMLFFCKEFYEKNDHVNINFTLQRDSFNNKPLMILKTIIKCHS